MTASLRFDAPHATGVRRLTVGVDLSGSCRRMSAALIEADGSGIDAKTRVLGVRGCRVPEGATRLYGELADSPRCPAGILATLRAQLAEVEAALIADLLADLSVACARVLAVGVHDPGFWRVGDCQSPGYLSLCDAARLAEATGMNIIDAFPARDLAVGGLGGPVTALAEWLLLRSPQSNQILLNLGGAVHLTYLPAQETPHAASRVLAFDVGPGTRLLDALTVRLTEGQHAFDPGGRFAVQGRRIPEIVDHWLKDPHFERPIPRWHPRGVRPERFLADALQMALDSDWSVRDLLCSATHFVAEAVAQETLRCVPDDLGLDQVVITGGGQHNGMLLREISRRLAPTPVRRLGDLGFPSEAVESASVGVLARLHIDQIPANHPAVTGADMCRVLGRLTPGSPQNWQGLLRVLGDSKPTMRPLRSAL